MHIEMGQDILYRIEDKEKHISLSDIKKVLETPNMIVICLRGNLILPVKKTGFIQGERNTVLSISGVREGADKEGDACKREPYT